MVGVTTAEVEMRSVCETNAVSPNSMGGLMYCMLAQPHAAVGMLCKVSADLLGLRAICKETAEAPEVFAVKRDLGAQTVQRVWMHS